MFVLFLERDGNKYCEDCMHSSVCGGCNKPVHHFISALGKAWHQECFRCVIRAIKIKSHMWHEMKSCAGTYNFL